MFYDFRKDPSLTRLSTTEVSLTLRIAEAVSLAGGRALVVGGYPRGIVMHELLGSPDDAKDVDLEVYGLTLEQLQRFIEPIHHVNEVGRSFGVLKVGPLDVSLPRRDSKAGHGHRGFEIIADPHMSPREAARRRDLTINTMAIDPLTGELIDEWHGTKDIERRLLRLTDPATFGDDPLRSLRVMQFAGRFDFAIDPATADICRNFDLTELSGERIGEEWRKLLLHAERPSIGLRAGRELGIIEQLHPELQALIETPQEPEWHPEGSVWNHTLLAVDIAAGIIRREGLGQDEALTLMLAALCHDIGKPATTRRDPKDGRIHSHEHARVGTTIARQFMKSLHIPGDISKKVQHLVFDHMFLPEVRRARDAAIRRLAQRLQPATIQELIWLTEADFCGRTIDNPDLSLIRLFQKRAEDLAVADAAIQPLFQGRDLMALGLAPGREMGNILHQLFEEQIDGQFCTLEEGIAYYKQHLHPAID